MIIKFVVDDKTTSLISDLSKRQLTKQEMFNTLRNRTEGDVCAEIVEIKQTMQEHIRLLYWLEKVLKQLKDEVGLI